MAIQLGGLQGRMIGKVMQNTLKEQEKARQHALVEWTPEIKQQMIIYGIILCIDILVWFIIGIISFAAYKVDHFGEEEPAKFGDVFPMLWVVVSGYYGHVEHLFVLFLSPMRHTTLGQNFIYGTMLYMALGIILFSHAIFFLVLFIDTLSLL